MEQIKFEEVRGELEAKSCFETIIQNLFESDSSFHVKEGTSRRFQFLFFGRFLLVLKKKKISGGRLGTNQ